ncbi:MAG TPA: helix-turn-helix domain-containing protein [Woeseiaceae bacterium]|jgi:AraC-like DNA-binding protein|nr:helix-turn-helix domain-containing protein [Woeseiaceae bacterium]
MTRQQERFDHFLSVIDQVFCPMHCAPEDGAERFAAKLDAVDLGVLRLARISTSPVAVTRRPRDIARIEDPPYLLKFQIRGEARWSQRGREVYLHPGDFVIASTAEPYRLDLRVPYQMLVVAVPGTTMRRLSGDPEQFLGRRMPAEDAACGLLSSFVVQAAGRLPRLPEAMAERVQTNVLDLLGGVLDARARTPVDRSPDAQRRRIKRFIEQNLRLRHLGPEMIAGKFGISTRYLHKLFAREEHTVAQYIRTERLRACRRALADPVCADTSITDIALQWGFYDLPHMTRCFREVYGVTPKEFRRSPGGSL